MRHPTHQRNPSHLQDPTQQHDPSEQRNARHHAAAGVVALLLAAATVVPAGVLADRSWQRPVSVATAPPIPTLGAITPPRRIHEASASLPVAVAATPAPGGRGFWVVWSDGTVTASGTAVWYGDMAGRATNAAMAGIAATADGRGYWLLGADGGVFSFGDAGFAGSTGGLHINAAALQMTTSPGAAGYDFVAGDGGIFSFGGAPFYGSTGSLHLNRPVVGMASTGDGGGYWLVAADGGLFSFGDAGYHGSTGGTRLNAPIVAMAPTASGRGYWMVADDGGVFAFGDAAFYGSAVGRTGGSKVVGMVASAGGGGYWVVLSDGAVLAFGAAPPVAGAPGKVAAPPATAASGATSWEHSFEVTDAGGRPIRWDACEAVHYSVVDAGAPAGWDTDVASAIGQVAVATGMTFTMDGAYPTSSQVPTSSKLTINWARTLTGGDDVGLTTYDYILDSRWTPQITGATIQVLAGLTAGGGTGGELPVLLHELGHAVGLGHTLGAEVMNAVDQGYVAYGVGDLDGLAKVGMSAGCAGFYS